MIRIPIKKINTCDSEQNRTFLALFLVVSNLFTSKALNIKIWIHLLSLSGHFIRV